MKNYKELFDGLLEVPSNASITELEKLKQDRYARARELGIVAKLALIREWVCGDSRIGLPDGRFAPGERLYLFNSGEGYLRARIFTPDGTGGHSIKTVLEGRGAEGFIIPGEWLDVALGHLEEAKAYKLAHEQRLAQKERQELLKQLI